MKLAEEARRAFTREKPGVPSSSVTYGTSSSGTPGFSLVNARLEAGRPLSLPLSLTPGGGLTLIPRHFKEEKLTPKQALSMYKVIRIPKAKGKLRILHAPNEELKKKQRQLLWNEYRTGVGAGPHAFGFVRKKGIRDHAKEHMGREFIFRIDIKDFFPSVRPSHLIKAWTFEKMTKSEIETRCGVAPFVGDLMKIPPPFGLVDLAFIPVTVSGGGTTRGLPQGSPLSPYLGNVAMKPIDFKIASLLKKWGPRDAKYSRYADDLIISSDDKAILPMAAVIRKILDSNGFKENRSKFRVYRKTMRQAICGVVVNEKLALPKPQRKLYRAKLHRLFQETVQGKDREGKEVIWPDLAKRYRSVAGEFSFMEYISPEEKKKYEPQLNAVQAILRARQVL